MSEMIDRIAATLKRLPIRDRDHPDSELDRLRLREAARAVLNDLKEPTEEMLSAGDSMMPQIAAGEDITTGYDALKEAWPAMIDAAHT